MKTFSESDIESGTINVEKKLKMPFANFMALVSF